MAFVFGGALLGSARVGGQAAVRVGGRANARRSCAVRMTASKVPEKDPATMSLKQWQQVLTPEQFQILRLKGTEYPGTGEYNKMYPESGVFKCAGCNTPLFEAKTKFDSRSGWPAFYEGIGDNVQEIPDNDGFRTEIVCRNCGGHLGHVFKGEGFGNPVDARHCVNSISLKYEEE